MNNNYSNDYTLRREKIRKKKQNIFNIMIFCKITMIQQLHDFL